MARLEYIVEIKTRDGKTTKHICNDFPGISGDFITLYKDNFVRERVRFEAIENIKEYWRGGGKRN